ncbi:MAG: carboxypeptidase-like regulatory domain-containing protein, partial [Vicinamibacterales bacterium]
MKARTLIAVAVLALPIALAAQTAQPTPPAQPAQPGAQRKPIQAARTPLEIRVTSRAGEPLAAVAVTVTGSVGRSGETDDGGVLVLRSVPPGQYRLRFTCNGWITLERDVTVRGAAATRVEVALSPAEAPPPQPPQPEPAPAPAPTPAPAPSANVEPKTVFI